MTRIGTSFATVLLAAIVNGTPVLADPIVLDAFGHSFEIRRGDAFEELLLGGDKVHENGFILLDAVGVVGVTPVVVGTSATGGNLCGEAPFVVWFPPDRIPIFDGPIDTCAALETSFAEGAILFRGRPSALGPGEQWAWRPGSGFVEEAPVAFVPRKESGFDAIIRGEISHPFDLLDYADTYSIATDLMGDAREDVLFTLSGPGTGERLGDLFVGEACYPHNCPFSQALIVADAASRRLFLAWRIDGVETVMPGEAAWPNPVHDALVRWQAANAAIGKRLE